MIIEKRFLPRTANCSKIIKKVSFYRYSILFLHCILKLIYYQMRQPLPSLICSANQVRGALMPRDPVVVVTAPENITNILPTSQLLTEQHVESERERKSRVELTKRNTCASLDAGKTERQVAQEYHLESRIVSWNMVYKRKQKWDRLVRRGCGSMNQYQSPRPNASLYEAGANMPANSAGSSHWSYEDNDVFVFLW